jgi:hypothetical protein
MKPTAELMVAEERNMDRRLIRIDRPSTHAGIAAALRRAFAGVSCDCAPREFEDLLRRLS